LAFPFIYHTSIDREAANLEGDPARATASATLFPVPARAGDLRADAALTPAASDVPLLLKKLVSSKRRVRACCACPTSAALSGRFIKTSAYEPPQPGA
jgi:hypothetical protein